MLLTAYEASQILDVKLNHVYYLFRMQKTDGAIKVLNDWRIDIESLRVLYERINEERTELFAVNIEFKGFNERFENILKKRLQNGTGSEATRIQGRKGLECFTVGFNSMAGRKRMIQQELWSDGNFW